MKPENEKKAVSQEDLQNVLSIVGELKDKLEESNKLIKNQDSLIKELKDKDANPTKRRKPIVNKEIKDEDRTVKIHTLNIELTEDDKFIYFEEDRQRLIDKKLIKRYLLIRSIDSLYNVLMNGTDRVLFARFNCIDVKGNEFKVEMPMDAFREIRETIKARTYKTYKKHNEIKEGVMTKLVKDEDGRVVDEYEIDLINSTTNYWYDLEVVTECGFKGKKFEKVPEEEINLL